MGAATPPPAAAESPAPGLGRGAARTHRCDQRGSTSPDLPTGTPLKLADPPSDNSRAGRARTVHPAVGPRATENAPSGAAFGSAVVFDLGPVEGDPPPF